MKRRGKKMIDILVLVMISVILGSFGQIYLKKGLSVSPLQASDLFSIRIFKSLFQRDVLVGVLLYAISTLVWFMVLSKAQLSYAYPLIGLGYALTALLAKLYFGEQVSLMRWLGIAIIICGAFLVTRS